MVADVGDGDEQLARLARIDNNAAIDDPNTNASRTPCGAALQWTRSEDGNSVRAEMDGVTFTVRIAAVR